MARQHFISTFAIAVVFLMKGFVVAEFGEASVEAKEGDRKPNILFILTDDQGWTTPSCYGNRFVQTPHLDRLAQQGLRFTDAYVTPQCTPTRASLMTGQHTARSRMWHVIAWYGLPWARVTEPPFAENLEPQDCRLPLLLRAAGYTTGIAGKWHLTNNQFGDYRSLQADAGLEFGFDYVGPPGPGSQDEGDKWVDHLTKTACQFIQDNQEGPWFFYLAHHTLHGTVSAPPDLIQKYLGGGAPETGLHNATYLAAIEHLDNSVGRLMQQLDNLELADITLVIFLSDNGGLETVHLWPERSEGLLGGAESLSVRLQEFDNAPLREGKGSVYEGGIRVPCIVRWPTVISAGQVSSTPIHIVDWLPTLLSVAGQEASRTREPNDGVDLTPLFLGERIVERPLFWYMPLYDLGWGATPSAIVREGDWKLIEFFGDWFDEELRYHGGNRLELYHLKNDLSETNSLADEHPERVQKMREQLHDWIRSTGATLPGLNPHFDPSRAFERSKQKQAWNY